MLLFKRWQRLKKVKIPNNCVIQQNFKFEDYKNCLQENRIENRNEKNKLNIDNLWKNHEEFIKKTIDWY